MTAVAEAPSPETFRARAILVLVLVGVAALAAFGVLAAYAPELRSRANGGPHALSSSAVGFRGATMLLRDVGVPVTVSHDRPSPRLLGAAGLVLTPPPGDKPVDMAAFGDPLRTLIVLPKWRTTPDPKRDGFVRKAGVLWSGVGSVLPGEPGRTAVTVERGASRRALRAVGGPFGSGEALPIGRIDGLQTISGPDWAPVLADEHGHAVLAVSRHDRRLFVLAEPDLLNNHGLSDLERARVAVMIMQMLSGEEGVVFDVTLNGVGRGRSLGRLMLEPPLLAATLCVAAAALLMGWRALARFGAATIPQQAIAPGAAALVDNAAGLIRTAGKEAALAPEYAALTRRLVAEGAGAAGLGQADAESSSWLARAAERRALADPNALSAEAATVKTPRELMTLARKLYDWRLEMTRERG